MTPIAISSRQTMGWQKCEPVVRAVVIAIAVAGIASLTLSLLGHLQVVVGLNALTQALPLMTAGLSVAAVVGSVMLAACPEKILHPEDPLVLKQALDTLCGELIEAVGSHDPIESIQLLAQQIPLEDIERAVHAAYGSQRSAHEISQVMLGQAQFYLESIRQPTPSCDARIQDFCDTLLEFFDSLFAAFGIAEFVKPTENEFHAEFKFQKIMLLISFFALLTSTLLPFLSFTTASSAVGGTLLFLCLMSVIWPKIRPMPTTVPEGENWSKQIEMGKMIPPIGREPEAQQIREKIGEGQPLLIIGATGVGVTSSLQAFIAAKKNYPELADKIVVYYNMADLVANYDLFGYGNTILKRINDTVKSHPGKYIHVFDHIALAYQAREGTDIGSQLRTFFDKKPENAFPLVIGLATLDEYEKWIYTSREADDRRFENHVFIKDMEQKNALAVMRRDLFRKAPDVIVEEGALELLFELTKIGPQPHLSLKMISRCLKRIAYTQKTPLDDAIEKKHHELQAENSKLAIMGNASRASEEVAFTKIGGLTRDLETLGEKHTTQKNALDKLTATRAVLAKARELKFQSIQDTANVKSEDLGEGEREKLAEMLLIKYFLEEPLEKATEIEGIQTKITKLLVQDVFKEYLDNQKEQTTAIAQSRERQTARQPAAPSNGPQDHH